MKTRRVTMAQALVGFLKNQYVERDGRESPFFAGAWGILGHGIIAGLGQALQENPDFPYRICRNEQAAAHIASAYAKARNRLATFACISSIGPGATNMITGAALATINRLPVLLLPGDIFARRNVAPVLQQLESEHSQDVSVNDAFRPVSRYWDRINRPDQLLCALPEAMRVLTSPAQTGAVTLALPQDVQAEAFDYPEELFARRVWHIARPEPDRAMLARAVQWIRAARRPLIVAGGGVLYSEASGALAHFAALTGIPVGESQAGKGSLAFDHPQNLGAIGVTGTPGANIAAREADLVIAIGTRLSDFTTASKTAFQNPNVRFVNINVAEFDAFKHAALPLVADARAVLGQLAELLAEYNVEAGYAESIQRWKKEWEHETDRIYNLRHGPPISQGEVIGAVNRISQPQDIVLCAAGSLPGDLHKLWRTRRPNGYHLEYGYSCMGYEIAGGIGAKMAHPDRDVYVMVGDGSYLMMNSEITTSVQEGVKLNIIVLDNHGFSSIGGLSHAIGSSGFGTSYPLPVDFEAISRALGAHAVRATTRDEVESAIASMRGHDRTSVVVVEVDKEQRVPGYESWWDVQISEVSQLAPVRAARAEYADAVVKERRHEIAVPHHELRVGNAPCSWGTLEFGETRGEQTGFARMLDELAATGYTGTELGDWGYMPVDPCQLRAELNRRRLDMLGAFVPVALKDPAALSVGIETAVRTARLLAAVSGDPPPYLVLADNNGTVPERTRNAGRVTPAMALGEAEWRRFSSGANRVAREVYDATGLRTVFHHHCAGYIETPDEIARLLDLTDPNLLGIVFDTGHYCFGAGCGDLIPALERFGERIQYIHLKDCDPQVMAWARTEGWDYFESLRHGIFCELGKGCVDFPALLHWLKSRHYAGYVVVEQDVLPGTGTPRESAARNRQYLHSIESHYS